MKVRFASENGKGDEFNCNSCSVRNRFKSLKELQHHQDQDHNQESGYETLEAEVDEPAYDDSTFDTSYDTGIMILPIKRSCSRCGKVANIMKLKAHMRICEYQPETSPETGSFQATGLLIRKLLGQRPFFASLQNNIRFIGTDDVSQIQITCKADSYITYKLYFRSVQLKCSKFTIHGNSKKTSRFRLPLTLLDEESFTFTLIYKIQTDSKVQMRKLKMET